MGANAQSLAPAAKIASERADCYRLQLEGLSIRAIAKRTGLSVGTVHKRINAQCEAVVQPLAEQVRQRHLEQIQAWLAKLNAQVDEGRAVPRCVEVGTRLLEREARLLGIDAPEKIEQHITEITQEDLALAELVREAQAAAAVEEARIRRTTDTWSRG